MTPRQKFVEANDCVIWPGRISSYGYGMAGRAGRAHRIAYQKYHGVSLVPRQHVHHLCGVRSCVNVAHLEVVDAGVHATEHNTGRLKSHCKWGHEFKPETTHYDRLGKRICWICQSARFRRYRKEKRATILKEVFDD